MTNAKEKHHTANSHGKSNNVVPLHDTGDTAEDIARIYARTLSRETPKYGPEHILVFGVACTVSVLCWIGIFHGLSYIMGLLP